MVVSDSRDTIETSPEGRREESEILSIPHVVETYQFKDTKFISTWVNKRGMCIVHILLYSGA